jgi:outer membrane lipoprotein-sorting protein
VLPAVELRKRKKKRMNKKRRLVMTISATSASLAAITALVIAGATLIIAGAAHAQDADEIMKAADQHMRGKTNYSEMTMQVVRPDWSRKTTMKAWSKGTAYSLILITAPARDKGTSFLKRNSEIWNWLPSVEKVIKIPPSMMMQSWMGSDFTNDDLIKESSMVHDYTHEIAGDSVIDGHDCYRIKLVPRPDAAVVWGKLYVWVMKDEPIELRVEYFDEDGELINIETLSNIKTLGGRRIPSIMTMTPVDKEGHATILTIQDAEYDKPMEDSFFSEQQMKRLR